MKTLSWRKLCKSSFQCSTVSFCITSHNGFKGPWPPFCQNRVTTVSYLLRKWQKWEMCSCSISSKKYSEVSSASVLHCGRISGESHLSQTLPSNRWVHLTGIWSFRAFWLLLKKKKKKSYGLGLSLNWVKTIFCNICDPIMRKWIAPFSGWGQM